MLRYRVAFYLPRTPGGMAIAEALDFPGAVTQGFDLADARLMIASALEDLASLCLSRIPTRRLPKLTSLNRSRCPFMQEALARETA